MRPISDSCRMLRNKKGSQMVEAAVTVPLLILTAMLLLRVFTFYLEILSAGISEHMTALEAWDEYRGIGVKKYSAHREVRMLKGGILRFDLCKQIETRSSLLNEDNLVRAGELFD